MSWISRIYSMLKEETIMSEKAKSIHNAYCDYEVAKAKQPSRIYSVRAEIKTKNGIKISFYTYTKFNL